MRDIGGRRREDCLHNHIQGVSPISAEAAEESNWALAQAAGTAGTPLLGPPYQDGCSASSSGASPWDQQHERGFPGKQVEGRCLLSIFPQGDSEEKNQISTLATHGSCGMYLESSAGTPSPLLCRSRDIIRAVLWTILVLRRCQEDSHFKTGLFSPSGDTIRRCLYLKRPFLDSFQSQGNFVHPGEKQLFVSKFICKLSLRPDQNLYVELIPVQRAAPSSARVHPFLCQEHHPVASLAMALSLRNKKTKILEGEGKIRNLGLYKELYGQAGQNPCVFIL